MMLGSAVIVTVVLRQSKALTDSLSPVLLRQLEIVDKATTLAAAADVQAYQGIQVMQQPVVGYDGDSYDPSDEAEAEREAARRGLSMEEISEAEADELRNLLS